MISKAEVLQKLKKMGMVVADDASIVTVLLPKDISFETGLKDVRSKLTELGYESSFCVKQSKDNSMSKDNSGAKVVDVIAQEEPVEAEEDSLSAEEINSYMAVDSEGNFSLDDDGQFSLGLEF